MLPRMNKPTWTDAPLATDLTLRSFQKPDLHELHEIDQACYPPGIAYSKGTLRWFLRQPGAICLVGELAGKKDGALVSFIIAEQEGERGHIVTLDVLQEFRQAGIGTLLLAAAERELSSRGVARVELETAVDNAPAIAFWQKHGYRTHGILKRYYLDRVDALWMQKTLPAQGT